MIKIEKLIKNNNLGNEILSISKVTGGLSHKMYKVVTDEKIYAVKELNQGIMKNSDAYSNFVFSEQVADIVIKNKILAIGAIKLDNDIMKKIDNDYFMIFNWFDGGNEDEWGRTYYNNSTYMMWEKDKSKEVPKIHPAQKPVAVLKRLIEIFTDPGDVVIDPCCGSGTTLRAAYELGRSAYGFEIDRNFYQRAKDEMLNFAKEE